MIRSVLVDLSGTLHIENQVVPGAVTALKRLLDTNVRIKFVTNTTKESQNVLYTRLTNLGFPIQKEQIFSSLEAAKSFVIHEHLKPLLFLSPEAMEDFEGLACSPDTNPNAVVIGLAPTEFHYDKLNEAFRCLINGAKLIAIHAGKYYKTKSGLSLGPGCFVKGLEYSAQCSAILIGKPERSFFLSALNGIPPEEVIMIGDDVTDDIEGAMKVGIKGYLVQTGKYRPGDENKISVYPDGIFPSFVEAVDKIIKDISK